MELVEGRDEPASPPLLLAPHGRMLAPADPAANHSELDDELLRELDQASPPCSYIWIEDV